MLRLLIRPSGRGWLTSTMLRNASVSLPACRPFARITACSGVTSIVAGPADHRFLTVLVLDRLIDRENANVFHDCLRRPDGVFASLHADREDDVDAIVRQHETAGCAFDGDFGCDSAHSRRQDRRHETGARRRDELLFADRLARDERGAGRSCL